MNLIAFILLMSLQSVLSMTPAQLREAAEFIVVPVKEQHLRIDIYEAPIKGHRYALGFDAAYGILGRDDDAVSVMDKETSPVRQVAEIQGKLGERLDRVVYACAKYYNDAFVVGERQVGLATLRRLITEYEYTYLYYERDEVKRGRPPMDKLGHPRVHDDVHLRELRRASIDHEFELRSEALIDQMTRTEFRDRNKPAMDDSERKEDEKLVVKLAGGGSPDLVMALCYTWLGIREMGKFPAPRDPDAVALEDWLGESQQPQTHFARKGSRSRA